MGRYYNKTRSPISTTLRDGTTGYFPSKKWITLSSEQEGVSALAQWVNKGILVRRPDKVASVMPAPAPVAAPVIAPAPAPAPVAPTPPVVEPTPEPEIDVHVDTTITPEETSADVDRTSISDEVGENTIALEGETDTESKTTKRSKSRRRG